MNKAELDTPALLVDMDTMRHNVALMQAKADEKRVALRPHTKTHRTPALARMQIAAGARGITVAKVGEAEVMAAEGIDDIFIANEVVGESKVKRLRALGRKVKMSVGVDNVEQVQALSEAFLHEEHPIDLLIEIEVGERRSGLLPGVDLVELARLIDVTPGVRLKGIFSHEGHSYGAATAADCAALARQSQEDTLLAAQLIRDAGIEVVTVSIGSTPSLLLGTIMPGITEIRPGTYILMDAAQGAAIQDYSRCAATVLATVVSKPTAERVVLDAGVKALTAFTRDKGICHTPGYGLIKGTGVRLSKLYDEHGLILDRTLNQQLRIGDKVEIIPNHICPTCNLYDQMYLVRNGEVVDKLPILGRGRSQ